MPKWRVQREGAQWLLDTEGRVIGVRDRRGRDWHIPMVESDPASTEGTDDPVTSVPGGGSAVVVQRGDTTITAAATTLDFAAADFDVTDSPAGEANIAIGAAIARVTDVDAAIAALVASSPAALDTLNELAAALGNDANFATTVTNALAAKAPLLLTGLTGAGGASLPADTDTVLQAFNKLLALYSLFAGGTTGQVPKKSSAAAFDFTWAADDSGGASSLTVEDVAGATYTVVAADIGKIKRFTNAGGCTVTVPDALGAGFTVTLLKANGAGTITIEAGGTAAVTSSSGDLRLIDTRAMASLMPEAADTYVLVGAVGSDTESVQDVIGALIVAAGGTYADNGDGGGTIDLAPAVHAVTVKWAMSFTLPGTVTDGDYTLFLKLPSGATITETTTKCAAGTATATIKINTTALGGTANSVSSVEDSQAHGTANAAVAGDDFNVTISAASTLSDVTITLSGTRPLE